MRSATRFAVLLSSVVFLPTVAFAQQASITGVVRDASGAVLPGVTVEASSPALIEQSRTVVSDETGQYRIVDLRAGTYVVTFTLQGFTTFRREGIALTATFIATINADLRVAAVAETITVSGESPTVDVQSASTVRTIDNEVFAGIPSSRGYAAVTVLMPGITAQGADVGGVKGDAFSVFQAHGGRRNEGQVQVNGLSAGWLGMGVSGYVPEVGAAEEISFQVTGGLGEAGTGGPQMNLIPREGGNRFGGTMFFNFAGDGWQGSNLSGAQKDLGLREINKLVKTWDINPMFGGPVMRDRLWFFATARHFYTENTVAGIFLNRNAGDATKWTYDPGNQQAIFDNVTKNASVRLTWQASPRNKVAFWWDEQVTCQRCDGKGGVSFASPLTGGSLSPEADGGNDNPIRLAQANWSSPVTNRLLLEASFGIGPWAKFGGNELPNNNRDLIPVIEAAGAVPGIEYRGQGRAAWARNYGNMFTFSGSLSYITGSHRFKVGGRQQRTHAAFPVPFYNNERLAYNFSNALPATLTMYANHGADNPYWMYTTAFYAQDHWTHGRLTLQGGLRFERISSFYPESRFNADRFLPVALTFPAQDADVSPKDINPRFAASYDLFGTGRTAVKFNLGRYPTADNAYGAYGLLQQPANRVATSTNRNWNDLTFPLGDSRRGNYSPDCDLMNPAANGECGAWTNQNFGKYVVSTTYDPEVLNGWNVREYSWDLSVGVQHEIAPRTSLEVTYVRRSWGNQTVTDNRAVTAADFDRFDLTAPADARLPGGGNYAVQGFYDVKSERFGLVDNFVTFARNFGQGRIETYNGVDINVNARFLGGLTAQGGLNIGQSALNDCDVWSALPEIIAPGFPFTRTPLAFCDQTSGWQKSFGGLATYVIPKAEVQVAATIQSRPFAGANFPGIASQSLAANWLVLNGAIAPALGRSLAGNAALASLNVVKPGTMYGDRLNKVDFRVSKIFRFGSQRANVGVDFFNVFNANSVVQYFQTLNTATPLAYLQPADLVAARFAKISVQFDF